MAEALGEVKTPLRVLDLALADDWKVALLKELEAGEPIAIGISVRNTDDCSFITQKSFLPWITDVVEEVRYYCNSPIILGGPGFSVMPEAILRLTKADIGIIGDAEEAMLALVNRLMVKNDYRDLANLIFKNGDEVIRNKVVFGELASSPLPGRRMFDNKKYQDLGAMVGVETKRGCPGKCVYCADPVIKGKQIRLRPHKLVVDELKDLIDQGVSWFHLCDSEFNIPITHAKELCRAIIDSGLSSKVNWYCYCSPVPFDFELAGLMHQAGCKGVNFGVDSLSDVQLLRLGREHNLDSVKTLVNVLNKQGLNYIFDLLVGGPGETEATIKESILGIKNLGVPLSGVSIGIRVYPGTYLARALSHGFSKDGLYPSDANYYDPTFFVSPYLENEALKITQHIIGDDSRFLLLSNPAEQGSYNYADDEYLSEIIKTGERGAYWDIISRDKIHRR